MDIFEALFTRRSIRKYTTEDVNPEHVGILLKSAMLAPSARNERPWHFVVARDPKIREGLSKTSPYMGMAVQAPVVIVVCADLNEARGEEFWIQDCSAAIENLMLAARGLDLGSVWCGIYPVKERVDHARAQVGLPENIVPLGLVCVGHPDQKFFEADRFQEDRIHNDKW